jgi:hypothetical protein
MVIVILHLCRPITKGVSNTITITPTWTGTKVHLAGAVWIDYNKMVFLDAGELVYVKPHLKQPPVSGSFTVPTLCGKWTTQMRVL